ncbi:hypothetical protein SO3561_10481 [Streptomyces olivochromogenes]|uniref:Uncharacterized protein n=1 Tax=Streptomyces olivochromogenes TaxID=1963 RepID=A0A286PH77_STROL|nr:hypothetical protein SO3561_10481 [Streptomyces olivochromogenes]
MNFILRTGARTDDAVHWASANLNPQVKVLA